MKKDRGLSKEQECNSTPVIESMVEEKANQRDNIEPLSLSEAYSNVSKFQSKNKCVLTLYRSNISYKILEHQFFQIQTLEENFFFQGH